MDRVRIKVKDGGRILEVRPVDAREWIAAELAEPVADPAPETKEPKAPAVQKVPAPARAKKPVEKSKPEED